MFKMYGSLRKIVFFGLWWWPWTDFISFRLFLGVFSITGHVTSTEVPGIGSCPRVNIIPNFDLSRFFGRWYDYIYLWNNNYFTNKYVEGMKYVPILINWQLVDDAYIQHSVGPKIME